MAYEVEISKPLISRLSLLIGLLGLILLGYFNSSEASDGIPRVLSPGLARTQKYLNQVSNWLAQFDATSQEFGRLVLTADGDILRMSTRINRVAGDLAYLQQEIDGTSVPDGLELLQEDLLFLTVNYQEAITLFSKWVSAPTPDNYNQFAAYLDQLLASLNEIKQSPWIGPGSDLVGQLILPTEMATATRLAPDNLEDYRLPSPEDSAPASTPIPDR